MENDKALLLSVVTIEKMLKDVYSTSSQLSQVENSLFMKFSFNFYCRDLSVDASSTFICTRTHTPPPLLHRLHLCVQCVGEIRTLGEHNQRPLIQWHSLFDWVDTTS